MGRKPKLPKVEKLPRPLLSNLRKTLQGLVSVSIENRIAALSMALQWYTHAVPYLIQKERLTPAQIKSLVAAQRLKKLGLESADLNVREHAFIDSLRIFEQACTVIRPPKIDKFYEEFSVKQPALLAKQLRLQYNYGTVLNLLQQAIGNRLTLRVADARKPIQFDPHLRTISYNRPAAKKLTEKFHKDGLLAVFFDQLDEFTRGFTLAENGDGSYREDSSLYKNAVHELLDSFVIFAKKNDAPNRLVKKLKSTVVNRG
jgi:hypothetical protein